VGGVGIWFADFQMSFSQNFETKVHQGMKRKVVDLAILYNFCKGRRAFFSTICAQIACQVGRFLGADE
jgi:hypothetical protein